MSGRYGTPVKERRRRGDGRREGRRISGQVSRKFRDNICNGNQRGSAPIVAYYTAVLIKRVTREGGREEKERNAGVGGEPSSASRRRVHRKVQLKPFQK